MLNVGSNTKINQQPTAPDRMDGSGKKESQIKMSHFSLSLLACQSHRKVVIGGLQVAQEKMIENCQNGKIGKIKL